MSPSLRSPKGRGPSGAASSSRGSVSALAACLLLAAGPVAALTPLAEVRLSPHTTTVLAGVTLADEALGADDLAGAVVPVALGALPGEAALAAYHLLGNGDQLLVFATVTTLPGPLVVGPRDVVRSSGGSFGLELAGVAAGIPAGSRIDALTVGAGGELVVSFDVTTTLGSLVADDADLVAIGGGPATLWLSATAAGIAGELDVDAVDRLANGHLLLSFDTGGALLGLGFADEDLLELDPLGPSWELAYDGSEQHAEWSAADLDALWALPGAAGPVPPAGELRFTTTVFSEDETAAFAMISVERVGGSSGAVAVSYFSADLTALTPDDYLVAMGSLSWADGELGIKTFDVPLVADVAIEGAEDARLVLTSPLGGAVLGQPALARLRILDDEAPAVVEIPTVGELGLVLLTLLLFAAGWWRLIGRRPA